MGGHLHVASAFLMRGTKTYVSRRSGQVAFGGLIQNPGGKLDPGENPLQAVVREIAEETGLAIATGRFQALCDTMVPLKGGGPVRVHTFIAELAAHEVPRLIEAGKSGPWMPLDVEVLCQCPLGFTPAMPTVLPHLRRFVAARKAS
jgi:8-oxo-dGTP pyrophosphatase MutT (NUDIX family)